MHPGQGAYPKDILSLRECDAKRLMRILSLAKEMKRDRLKYKEALVGKSIALFFQKPSMRTRMAFQVGISELGGTSIFMGAHEEPLGTREPIIDVARVTSRYCAATVIRARRHEDVVDYARAATHPVINALCDQYHPCQTLADLFTIRENFDTINGLTIAWLGDANNVFHSLVIGVATLGANVIAAIPAAHAPGTAFVNSVTPLFKAGGGTFTVTQNPRTVLKHAQVVCTDTWTSMGQEAEREQRLADFAPFQLNKTLLNTMSRDGIILHCLPAYRGEEITDEAMEDPRSRIFDQAENRLHTQKALLYVLLCV